MDDDDRIQMIWPAASRQQLPGDFGGSMVGVSITSATLDFTYKFQSGLIVGRPPCFMADIPRW